MCECVFACVLVCAGKVAMKGRKEGEEYKHNKAVAWLIVFSAFFLFIVLPPLHAEEDEQDCMPQ